MEMPIRPYNVVCIEDDNDLSRLISISLRTWPAIVHIAHDGIHGLVLIREQKPDLILLDLGLPGLNGWEVCEAIKRDENLRHIPIVILTAIPPEIYDDRCEAKLIAGYLLKPFTPSTLRDLLQPYLPLRSAKV